MNSFAILAALTALFLGAVPAGAAAPGPPVSFRYDVLPTLSRAGCNQGSCHGNSEGRGGMKLSLKGEDPEADYAVLSRHGEGRRVNRADPGRSLLLLKATASVAHGGGMRFPVGSEEYAALAGWIASGAPDDRPGAPRLLGLDVTPAERILVAPAWRQRLIVRGRFSDGTVRDLARKVVYNCDEPRVTVSPDGEVTASGEADAAVLVRYTDRMETARLTFIPARKGFVWTPVPKHNAIDALNFRRLRELRLQPSALASDTEFLRRAYLDALGILPTPEEVRAFLAEAKDESAPTGVRSGGRRKDEEDAARTHPSSLIPHPSRATLIDSLLARPEFDDYWTLKWADVLRLEERSLDPKGLAGYREWIRTSIATNKPLDRLARELLTAGGSTYANPPANYYRRTRTPGDLAETTAQVFMGTRLLCAKCHNHPFERWKQDDYYALAAFFARVDRKIESVGRRDRFDLHEMIGEEFIAPSTKGEVTQPRTGRPMPPRLPFEAGPPALAGGSDRRTVFADWLTSPANPHFARAMVNRIWYHLMGRGLVDPVDDLRASNPASNPALLDFLARDFVASGYDLRHTVRLIMNSRTYQLCSTPNATNAADERFFSRAIARRLPAEVLLDAISQVTGSPEAFPGFPSGTRAVQIGTQRRRTPFLTVFGQPARESACECERTGDTALGQSFELISGQSIDTKLKRPDNRVGKLIAAGKSNAEIVTELYLTALTRFPTKRELARFEAHVTSRPERRQGLEDAVWALVNSKEFLLRR
jgi:hypothetical protein